MILPFDITDYDEVLSLWKRCEGIGLSGADERANILVYLERNPGSSFVARADGVLVGAVLCGHDGRRGFIHHLAVDPTWRRRGIGTALVEACVSSLRSNGIQKCHVSVYHENEGAVGWWSRRGWALRTDIAVMSAEIESV